jgi:hypothetical protein
MSIGAAPTQKWTRLHIGDFFQCKGGQETTADPKLFHLDPGRDVLSFSRGFGPIEWIDAYDWT